MEIFRAISSLSQSVVVRPSATLPHRGVMSAVYDNDDTSCVFPVPPWPTMPTLRMSLVGSLFRQTSMGRGPPCTLEARACAWLVVLGLESAALSLGPAKKDEELAKSPGPLSSGAYPLFGGSHEADASTADSGGQSVRLR